MNNPEFAQRILNWFDQHGRKNLPWQQDKTPYRVWVSEIMLQQTQVNTVIPYFQRFMQSFPDISSLADASLDEVLHHWSGLGYYARGRNLYKSSQIIRDRHNGIFPQNFEQAIDLPGIGRSTAGAILSLACGQRHAILDGNVKRVLARYHALEGWPGKTQVLNRLWQQAEALTPNERTDDYNQAMMDLGATVCRRGQPECIPCPLQSDCQAHRQNRQRDFPQPKPRKTLPKRETHMLILQNSHGEVLLERRPPAGIWGGLWSLPELPEQQEPQAWTQQRFTLDIENCQTLPAIEHTFSHFRLKIHPILARVTHSPASTVMEDDDTVWYKAGQKQSHGLAAPVQRLLETLQNQLEKPKQ